jgi:hypothetical protein
VFCVDAAPIVLSGQATFAGFLKLDDTSTWMALTDRVMTHGRSLAGLPPSRPRPLVPLALADHPSEWPLPPNVAFEVIPTSSGTVTAQVRVSRTTTYYVWLGGLAGARPQTDLTIDGKEVSSVGSG